MIEARDLRALLRFLDAKLNPLICWTVFLFDTVFRALIDGQNSCLDIEGCMSLNGKNTHTIHSDIAWTAKSHPTFYLKTPSNIPLHYPSRARGQLERRYGHSKGIQFLRNCFPRPRGQAWQLWLSWKSNSLGWIPENNLKDWELTFTSASKRCYCRFWIIPPY